ncbi:hypothetical protein Droror1_Dr00001269 [Drosera rotundifolia]
MSSHDHNRVERKQGKGKREEDGGDVAADRWHGDVLAAAAREQLQGEESERESGGRNEGEKEN